MHSWETFFSFLFMLHQQAFSGGVDHSLTSPKLATSNRAEEKMRDILHDLEDIRGKLQESFTLQESFPGKELREEQRQGELILLGEED